ncbi:hypothetical protein GCM10027596_31610 [Nocardioides korecus]
MSDKAPRTLADADPATPTALDAAAALRAAAALGQGDWTYSVALEVRDQLRVNLPRCLGLVDEWETRPSGLDERWLTLLAAFAAHEFDTAGLPAPAWTLEARLEEAWVLDTPMLPDAEVVEQTPDWLAARNIYIAPKDLGTF